MIVKICDKCKNVAVARGDSNNHFDGICECKDSNYWECDEDIYPMLRILWDKGYETLYSCSGHALSQKYTQKTVRKTTTVKFVRNTNYTDRDVYIVIDGDVKDKNLSKYKYGYAIIEEWHPVDIYLTEMIERGISLPENYKISADDNIFNEYIMKLYPDEYNDIINWVRNGTKKLYRIGIDPSFYENHNIRIDYIDDYLDLLELRHDVAMLVNQLPNNY